MVGHHPCAAEQGVLLSPRWKNGGGHRAARQRYAVPLDWLQPLELGTFFETVLAPALVQVGLAVSEPATATDPAVRSTCTKLGGIPLRQSNFRLPPTSCRCPSGWLGHGSYTLTLDTQGDWIPEEVGSVANNLQEPITARGGAGGIIDVA